MTSGDSYSQVHTSDLDVTQDSIKTNGPAITPITPTYQPSPSFSVSPPPLPQYWLSMTPPPPSLLTLSWSTLLSWDSSTSMLPIGSEVGKQATLESQMSICLSVHYQNPSASQNHTYQPLHASPISIMPMAQLVFHICESVSQISMITSLSAMPKRSLHSQNWLLNLV